MGTFKSIWGSLKRDTSSSLKKKPCWLPTSMCARNTSLSSCPFLFCRLPLACQRSVTLLRHLPECRGSLVSQRGGGAAEWDHTLCTVRNIKSHISSREPDVFFFAVFVVWSGHSTLHLDLFALQSVLCRCTQSRGTLIGNPIGRRSMCILTCCELRHCKPEAQHVNTQQAESNSRNVVIR